MNLNSVISLFRKGRADQRSFTGVKLGDYSLRIPESLAVAPGNNLLKHAQVYTLRLGNESSRHCNCGVWIDGQQVGTWRIDAKSEVTIERPVSDPGRFTFYALGTEDAKMAGLHGDNPEMGVINALFAPERENQMLYAAESPSSSHFGAEGGTGFSGLSTQAFSEAEDIDVDESKASILRIKLWCSDKPRPLSAPHQAGILI